MANISKNISFAIFTFTKFINYFLYKMGQAKQMLELTYRVKRLKAQFDLDPIFDGRAVGRRSEP